MKLIIGLGNPGKEYENTRHNAGFLTVDKVAKELNLEFKTQRFNALITETFVKGEKIMLIKPQTYMNLSGLPIRQIMDYYNVFEDDILVISDDVDLELGTIRIRARGSSGGQKGIQNIIDHIGTTEFLRLRIGIGKHPLIPMRHYVLGKIDPNTPIEKAAKAVMDFINGVDALELMNRYN